MAGGMWHVGRVPWGLPVGRRSLGSEPANGRRGFLGDVTVPPWGKPDAVGVFGAGHGAASEGIAAARGLCYLRNERSCGFPLARDGRSSKRLVARAAGAAGLGGYDLAVGAEAILSMHAPADAAIGAGNRGVRLRVDEHPLGTQQAAPFRRKFGLKIGFRHNQTSPFAARRMARFTATRASWTL
jgi:hypothetical protein